MKMKALINRLCAAVICLCMMPVVYAAAEGTASTITEKDVIFTDDFESYSSFEELSPKWFIDGNCDGCGFDTIDGKKSMYFTYSSGASPTIAMAKDTLQSDISEGTIKISFDTYLENTNDEIWSFLDYIQSDTQEDYGAHQFITIHKPVGGEAFIEGIKVDTGKWYKVEMTLNLGEGNKWTYGIGVYNQDGTLVGSTGKSNSDIMGTFRNINFTAWRSGKVYIDNFEVTNIERSLPFFDDFDSYPEGSAAPGMLNWTIEGYDSGQTSFTKIDESHGTTACVNSGTPRFGAYRLSNPLTSGKINLEFDTYITNDKELWNRVVLVPSNQNDWGANGIINIDCQPNGMANITTSGVTPVATNVAVNLWYTIKTTIDLDQKIYTVSVYNAVGERIGETVTELNAADMLSDFSTVSFTKWKDGVFYFDNVKMEIYTGESVRPAPELPMADDFDKYSDIDEAAQKWQMDDTTKGLSAIEDEEGRGKVFKLGLNAETDNTLIYRSLPRTVTSGTVNFSFSMKPAMTASTPILLFNSERSTFLPVMYISGGSIFCNTTEAAGYKLFDYTPGQWYDFKVTADVTNRRYKVKMTNMSGAEQESAWYDFDGFTFNNQTLNNIGSINFQIWSKKDDAAYLDNVYIAYDDTAPRLINDSISFADGSGKVMETKLTAVPTETAAIRFDFGVPMDTWYFNNDNIKITEKGTDSELEFTGTMDGGVYTAKLLTPFKANTEYTIFVSGEVDSLARVPLGTDFRLDIKTANGYSDGTVSYENGVLNALITNTTAEPNNYILIYAEYTGSSMTNMAVKRFTVEANVLNSLQDFDINSYIGTDFDTAKGFLWEDNSLVPIAETLISQ